MKSFFKKKWILDNFKRSSEQLAKLGIDQLFKNLYFAFFKILTFVQTHYQHPLIQNNLQMRPEGDINLCSAANNPSEIFLMTDMSKDRTALS